MPDYRRWFDGLADFIPVGTPEQVVDSLVYLFKKPICPVSSYDILEARVRFDWERIINGFWRLVL